MRASHASSRTADGGPGALIDWDLAATTAARLTRPGPSVGPGEARAAVSDLRRFAEEAEAHVRAYTGLHAPSGTAPVLVVDRPSWARANVEGFRAVLGPVIQRLAASRDQRGGRVDPLVSTVGPQVTAVEVGALLAYLSSKVLGQYDLFAAGPRENDGRLLLVAPNIVHAEREMDVSARDFRLWVCVHEETHRTQFTAVPWLRAYVQGEIASFLDHTDLDPAAVLGRLPQVVRSVSDVVRGRGEELTLIDAVQTPEQRAVLERITAVMSLLEGHADVVMDGVGPSVIPSVATIRARFQARRGGGGPADQVLRRLLGIDAKLRQYRDGAAFVRAVVDRVGMPGFNAVWSSPETLPTKQEIADPGAWVDRAHGRAALAD